MSPEGAHTGDSVNLANESLADNCPAPAYMQAMIKLVANHLREPHRSSLIFQAIMGQRQAKAPRNNETAITINMVTLSLNMMELKISCQGSRQRDHGDISSQM